MRLWKDQEKRGQGAGAGSPWVSVAAGVLVHVCGCCLFI